MPLRQDEYQNKPVYSAARDSSPGEGARNVFQEEIRASQRRRQEGDAASSAYSGVARSQADTPPPINVTAPTPTTYTSHQPGTNPFARTGSRRQFRRDDWDDSSDEEVGDMELRPTYTLSKPSGPGPYDPAASHFETQDTGYGSAAGGAPPSRVPQIVTESADGDLAGAPVSSPRPPPHGQPQSPNRGIQLVESYEPTRS